MDAREEVRLYYKNSFRILSDDVIDLVMNRQGVVVWTENCCLLARMVNSKDKDSWECLWEETEDPDAWYVHLMAGDVKVAMELAKKASPLPFVVFQRGLRDERVHKLSMEKLLKNRYKMEL